MSKQLLQVIAEQAPDMLERLSEGEILETILNLLTTSEQQGLVEMMIADWKGEPNYEIL